MLKNDNKKIFKNIYNIMFFIVLTFALYFAVLGKILKNLGGMKNEK